MTALSSTATLGEIRTPIAGGTSYIYRGGGVWDVYVQSGAAPDLAPYRTAAAQDIIDDAQNDALAAHVASSDPHPAYLTPTEGNAAYQPLDADLTALAGLTSAADKAPYYTGSAAAALMTVTAAGRALLDDADAAAQRTTLGLGALATLAGVGTALIDDDAVTYAKLQNVSATDKLLGRSSTGAGDVEEITCTAAGRALIDDADAAAQRTTLGVTSTADLGSVAAAKGASLIGIQDAGGLTTAANVEAALAELYGKVSAAAIVTALNTQLGSATWQTGADGAGTGMAPTASGSGWPVNSWCIAKNQSYSDVANGATIGGTSLGLFGINEEGYITATGTLTGVWKNVSGATVVGGNGYGSFVRTL